MSNPVVTRLLAVAVLVYLRPVAVSAQAPEEKREHALPIIADEPKTIDPGDLISPKLAAIARHDFSNSSLREIVAWLQNEHNLVVLVDKNSLAKIGVSPAEPISDRLHDEPIYLLLNRLRSLGLAWYFEDEILHITSTDLAKVRGTTRPYSVGDLLDTGYDLEHLEEVITQTIARDEWDDFGGEGVLNSLGDVLFVRQDAARQREVHALLEAFRKHARQTFVNDPQQHSRLREKLNDNVSVNFVDTPLETAIGRVGQLAGIDMRLDDAALRDAGVRQREPITLKINDRKLSTVLQALVLDLNLTWALRDGVLWITSHDQAESFLKTAVYDVRDLCRDADESYALIDAITAQADPTAWNEVGGLGAIAFAKPGTLVVTNEERIHMELVELLDTYRTALRTSKRRTQAEDDPNEVVTVYYRLHANMVGDLASLLPLLIRPGSWKSETQPDAPGQIFVSSSVPDFSQSDKIINVSNDEVQPQRSLVVARAVLILRQTRGAHDEVKEVIRRISSGDDRPDVGVMLGGMGGGGFGGGFFSVPPDRAAK